MANDWTTHLTVATVIEKDGKYLFVEEHTDGVVHSVYNQPAGHVEYAETLVAAAERETLEETGYVVTIEHLIGIYTYIPPAAPQRTYIRFCFLAQLTANEPQNTELDPDILRTVWMTAEQLQLSARARSPLVYQAIQDYEAGKSIPLSYLYEHPAPFQPHLNLDA